MIVLLLFLNFILMLVMPVVLGRVIYGRFRPSWSLFGIGATTFVLSQVGHIPFNLLVQRAGWLPADVESTRNLVITAVFLAFSAGIFEEVARYLTYRYWAKDARSWGQGLMLGAGHGGVEAILLGLIGLINFSIMLAIRNGAMLDIVSPEQLPLVEQQIATMLGLPWYEAVLGAAERLFAICFHLSASLLVMQAFVRNQKRWVLFAIGWHAVLDFIAVVGAVRLTPIMTEGILGIIALLSLVIIFKLRTAVPEKIEPEPLPEIQPVALKPIETDSDKLDSSKYS
ncbi:MAG: YhfC family intramembrane metalloprotease [Chloroflexi bacterium]|nr:YhfC family intramembrane metalloprotease [Chloroflexota bacterium]